MEVAGTQLVEKDIENLARGERGRPRGAEGAAAAGPDGRGPPRPLVAARGLRAFRRSD